MTQEAAAECENPGATMVMFEAGPMRIVKSVLSTVVEASAALLDVMSTVTLFTTRSVLLVSVTSSKFVAADAASGSSRAAIETAADPMNFFVMRVR